MVVRSPQIPHLLKTLRLISYEFALLQVVDNSAILFLSSFSMR